MSEEWSGECPYCGSFSGHLNNHIRMSTGEHGEYRQYPADWDKESRERVDRGSDSGGAAGGNTGSAGSGSATAQVQTSAGTGPSGSGAVEGGQQATQQAPSGQGGVTVGSEEIGHSGEAGGPAGEASPIDFSDGPDDVRTYNCGECDTEVEYHEDCPEGHELVWAVGGGAA